MVEVVVDAVVLPRTIFLPPVITISSLSHINCLITTQHAALLAGNKSQYWGGVVVVVVGIIIKPISQW